MLGESLLGCGGVRVWLVNVIVMWVMLAVDDREVSCVLAEVGVAGGSRYKMLATLAVGDGREDTILEVNGDDE